MNEPLSTGIEILDRKLGGGIPPGRTVVVSADPVSQSEALLYEVASSRRTLYVTTMRPESEVEAILNDVGTSEYKVVDGNGDPRFGDVVDLIRRLPDASHVVVDPMRPLESLDGFAYREFLTDLRNALHETESVAYLHCLRSREPGERRDVTEYLADVVFEITTTRDGDSIETYLSVPKYRRGQAPEDIIKLDLSTGVSVDFSRNIV